MGIVYRVTYSPIRCIVMFLFLELCYSLELLGQRATNRVIRERLADLHGAECVQRRG